MDATITVVAGSSKRSNCDVSLSSVLGTGYQQCSWQVVTLVTQLPLLDIVMTVDIREAAETPFGSQDNQLILGPLMKHPFVSSRTIQEKHVAEQILVREGGRVSMIGYFMAIILFFHWCDLRINGYIYFIMIWVSKNIGKEIFHSTINSTLTTFYKNIYSFR